MKKTLSIVLVAILIVGSVFGVAAATTATPDFATQDQVASGADASDYASTKSSMLYEVVDFTAPDKKVYSLKDDIIPSYTENENGDIVAGDTVDFDGTGMSITVRNKLTGKTETYKYECRYMENPEDGSLERVDRWLTFEFNTEPGTKLTAGEYAARVICITEDGSYVCVDIPFTLE